MTFIPDEKFDIGLPDDPNKVRFAVSGRATDLGTADPPVDVWEGFNLSASLSLYPFSSTAGTWAISSDNAADTQTVKILRLIDDFQIDSIEINLNGQNKVTLTGNTIRVLAMRNINSTNLAGNVFLYEDGPVTLGVPDTITDVRGFIAGNIANNMQQLITTIPKGFRAYLTQNILSTDISTGGQTDREAQFVITARPLGGVFVTTVPFSVHNKASTNLVTLNPWIVIGEKEDVKVICTNVVNNGTFVSGALFFVLQSDNVNDVAVIKNF